MSSDTKVPTIKVYHAEDGFSVVLSIDNGAVLEEVLEGNGSTLAAALEDLTDQAYRDEIGGM